MSRPGVGEWVRGRLWALPALLLACVLATGCSATGAGTAETGAMSEAAAQAQTEGASAATSAEAETSADEASATFDLENMPAYSGSPYVQLFGNEPQFSDADKARGSFEEYSELDSLGRCGVAFALIGTETMPTEERGSIGMVKPSGWHTVRYDGLVDGNYLYNRCHLIGYQLAGENANPKNLITGTRYLNVEGMLPFEDEVAAYVERTGNHVLYRVTPVFEGDNLVAAGVQMEAWSVEDEGAGVSFDVFCYNVQPGVDIDYATGDSSLAEEAQTESSQARAGEGSGVAEGSGAADGSSEGAEQSYVLNKNTKKFHLPSCDSASSIKAKNREDFTGTRDELIARGYEPCKSCNP